MHSVRGEGKVNLVEFLLCIGYDFPPLRSAFTLCGIIGNISPICLLVLQVIVKVTVNVSEKET